MNLHLARLIGLVVLVLGLVSAAGAQAPQGTVHLHNGGRIHGELMEVLPGEQVRLRLADGTVRTIPWSEVARVDDPSVAPAAAPAPVEPVVAPPPASAPPATPAPVEPYAEVPPSTDDVASRSEQVTLTLFGSLGLAGGISYDATLTDLSAGGDTVTRHEDSDFGPSFGGGAQVDAPLHPNFSLGGFARVLSFKPTEATERGLFIDFAFAPRARFPFAVGQHWGAFYVGVALGIGIVDTGNDVDPSISGVQVETSTSPLFLAGGGAGLQLLLTEVVGVAFELGWHHHFYTESVTATGLSAFGVVQTIEGEADFEGGQLMLQAGLMIGF